ncbi:MAG: 2-oxoacid:acceptor oxidoreductase family protein [Peptococcaceae bacterium]
MTKNWQVIFGGEGGQGLVVAGVVLGEAAVLDGKNATQTASYGIASRGGYAEAQVIISEREIEYPGVEVPDVILALTQDAIDKYYKHLDEKSLVLYDSSTITGPYSGKSLIGFPMTEEIRKLKKLENIDISINVLGLGVLIEETKLISLSSLEKVLKSRFKKGFDVNWRGVQAGSELVKRYHLMLTEINNT